MSDADDSEFDKEAERERLREKYEAEQADREAAQQMSDLLLKGATMTNSHCGQCGSPIFRSDGQEFCPNCSGQAAQAADAGDAGTAQSSTGAAQSTTTAADAQSGGDGSGNEAAPADAEPSPDERLRDVVSGNADGTDASAEPPDTGGTSIAERAAASVQSSGQDSASSGGDAAGGDASPGSASPSNEQSSTPAAPAAGDASLADAQQSLLNAITHHAQAATGAEPRAAEDHLEAASEAAEALATISQGD